MSHEAGSLAPPYFARGRRVGIRRGARFIFFMTSAQYWKAAAKRFYDNLSNLMEARTLEQQGEEEALLLREQNQRQWKELEERAPGE